MPSLFGGVENFNPAFQGRQLAIQSGQGAGQSISRGQNSATHRMNQNLQNQQFQFRRAQYIDQIKRLELLRSWLDSQIGDI